MTSRYFTNLASFLAADFSALSLVAGSPLLFSDDDAESALFAAPVPEVELTSADPEVELALRSAGCADDLTSPDESPSSSLLFLISVYQMRDNDATYKKTNCGSVWNDLAEVCA